MSSATYRRDLADFARAAGWTISMTNGGHVRLGHPSGAVVFAPNTPRRPGRALDNTRSLCRRLLRGGKGVRVMPETGGEARG
jgi:hypothetical protein